MCDTASRQRWDVRVSHQREREYPRRITAPVTTLTAATGEVLTGFTGSRPVGLGHRGKLSRCRGTRQRRCGSTRLATTTGPAAGAPVPFSIAALHPDRLCADRDDEWRRRDPDAPALCAGPGSEIAGMRAATRGPCRIPMPARREMSVAVDISGRPFLSGDPRTTTSVRTPARARPLPRPRPRRTLPRG